MDPYNEIKIKLAEFVRKYYLNILLKGILIFLGIGLLAFMAISGIEYFFWLGKLGRQILFFAFLITVLWLGYRYIVNPLLYLFKVKRGLTDKEASVLIGKHFGEVDDRLLNLIELRSYQGNNELIKAAIEERSSSLSNVPFSKAITYGKSLKWGRLVAIPVVLLGVLLLFGKLGEFFGSYNRVVNYNVAYSPPAPFDFILLNDSLRVLNNSSLTLRATTKGKIAPSSMTLHIGGEQLLMQHSGNAFEISLSPPLSSGSISFSANGFNSREYRIEALDVPRIDEFRMNLDYPTYLKRDKDVILGSGNAVVPEGTRVSFLVNGPFIDQVDFGSNKNNESFKKSDLGYAYSKTVKSNLFYSVSTSNHNVASYEKLDYHIEVVKDEYPKIKVETTDTVTAINRVSRVINVSDDYGIAKVRVKYFDVREPGEEKVWELAKGLNQAGRVEYTFPNGLNLEKGRDYGYYFEVVDNDAVNGGKSASSEVFRDRVLNDEELANQELDNQKNAVKGLERSVEELNNQEKELQEFNQEQNQKEGQLSFDDKRRINDFLEKQKEQEELMQNFGKELKEDIKDDPNSEIDDLLKERLERQEQKAKKNQELLEELKKVADKINKEELTQKLEDLAKSQKSSKRNLQQLVELTKRYYVVQKAANIANRLEELAEKQEKLSEEEKRDKEELEKQRELQKEFDKLSKEAEELKSDNRRLKKPFDIDFNENTKKSVEKDQQESIESLEQESGNEASPKPDGVSQKQKAASEKMKRLSESMRVSAMAGGGSSIAEDAEMLRQILDNLITFSVKQESLLDFVEENDIGFQNLTESIREEKNLKELFGHIDDSLFALSLRTPQLAELVNDQITEVYYNIDKSLESFAENRIYQGASHQQYVVSASNVLADYLAEVLDNMQMSMMPGQGQGQGSGFQLPDIIESQKGLSEKLGQKPGQEGQGSQGESGESGQSGELGESGESGEGESGEQGNSGQSGQGEKGEGQNGENGSENGNEGEGGKDGESGKGEGENGKNGKDGQGGNGSGNGNGQGGNGELEESLEEIYNIYKEQEEIKQRLENQLDDLINQEDRELGKKILYQMEQFQNELLENGITNRSRDRVNVIQHQLLKLENAELKQGEEKKREGVTNYKDYNGVEGDDSGINQNLKEKEILNRENLPLNTRFKKKVSDYFGQ